VCLTIVLEADANQRAALLAAAGDAARFGLRIHVEHPSRWPWARRRPVRAEITEDGGCACSLLSDDADWSAPAWVMRPEAVEPLALTLEVVVQRGLPGLAVEALWAGDRPEKAMKIKAGDLAALVRSKGLGTRVRYTIERAG
jgi:hypothetical protein